MIGQARLLEAAITNVTAPQLKQARNTLGAIVDVLQLLLGTEPLSVV